VYCGRKPGLGTSHGDCLVLYVQLRVMKRLVRPNRFFDYFRCLKQFSPLLPLVGRLGSGSWLRHLPALPVTRCALEPTNTCQATRQSGGDFIGSESSRFSQQIRFSVAPKWRSAAAYQFFSSRGIIGLQFASHYVAHKCVSGSAGALQCFSAMIC